MSSDPHPDRPVIRMTNVAMGSLRDAGALVVSGVDWTVTSGDYWVVAGLQGSGKTDFLGTTAGLMGPRSGDYEFLGEPMPIFDDARLGHRMRLGLVFEGGQLFNQMTVRHNLALPLAYHHNISILDAGELVNPLLDRTGLTALAEHTPGNIGRNWQKRVGLARALVLEPELLLLDNPLSGLDLRHLHWWLHFLDRLNRGEEREDGRPVTLVATTSDLRPWRTRARQFAVIRETRFGALGDRTQLEAVSAALANELLMGETGASPRGEGSRAS